MTTPTITITNIFTADSGSGPCLLDAARVPPGFASRLASSAREFASIALGVLDVVVGDPSQPRDLVGGQAANHLARRTDRQRPVGNRLALGNERIGADQAFLANYRAVQDYRLDANQRALADDATV